MLPIEDSLGSLKGVKLHVHFADDSPLHDHVTTNLSRLFFFLFENASPFGLLTRGP